jgi:hypothetical protein
MKTRFEVKKNTISINIHSVADAVLRLQHKNHHQQNNFGAIFLFI